MNGMSARITHLLNYVYVTFCEDVEIECNKKVHMLDKSLQKRKHEWIIETVPSYGTLAIVVDKDKVKDEGEIDEEIANILKKADVEINEEREILELEVLYGGEYGPDLKPVAEEKGMEEDEVVKIHTSKVYTCYMLGFTPGFVYLGDVDERIRVERLKIPRTLVPAGSVGLAGKQTGFYGINSPGGWRIIGRLKEKAFDVNRHPPSLVKPGDRVRFVRAEQ
jgi:inhibitor of KinA